METIGWIGAILLATCALPQVIDTIRKKTVEGLSALFIFWWLAGEIFTVVYVCYKAFRYPLIFNYGINILCCLVLIFLYFKYKRRI